MSHREMDTGRETPLILLVDDISKNIKELSAILKNGEYLITAAMDGKQALGMTQYLLPDLLLLDIMIPGIDGIEVCQRLKQRPETRDIPVILLTIQTESDDIRKGFRAGAVDYVTKPFNPEELILKVRNHLEFRKNRRMIRRFAQKLEQETEKSAMLEKKVDELTEALEERDHQLKKLNTMDSLTDLYNYKFIVKRLSESIAESIRYKHPLTVVLFDIDHFKRINTTHGHELGDKILAKMSNSIKNGLRQSDIAGRYSGEEFLIILPHTDLDGGYKTAERIRSTIEGLDWNGIPDLKVTVSGGVSALPNPENTDPGVKTENILYKLIMKADNLLFKAKESGRNRIELE